MDSIDVCGVCSYEVKIFFHKAIHLVKLDLLEKYSQLQYEYFEDNANFNYWNDYYYYYFNNYQLKFEKYIEAILICEKFNNGNLCINRVIEELKILGFSDLFGAVLVTTFLKKEKLIDEVSQDLRERISNKFFNSV